MPYADVEMRRAKAVEYRARRREQHKEYMREWRKTPAGKAWEGRIAGLRREREAAEPEKYRAMRRANKLRHRYGLSLDEYDAMLAAQGGVCAACRDSTRGRFHVDHDHKTGEVRAILCSGCNRAFGLLGEDPAVIRGLANYAELWTA